MPGLHTESLLALQFSVRRETQKIFWLDDVTQFSLTRIHSTITTRFSLHTSQFAFTWLIA